MNKEVKELYLSNSIVSDSKHLLIIFEDNTMVLKWCYKDIIEPRPNPQFVQVNSKTLLEYGEPNLFGVRERKPFKNEQGEIDKMWTKIL